MGTSEEVGGVPKGRHRLSRQESGGGQLWGAAEAQHQPVAPPRPGNPALRLAGACWQARGSAQGANVLLISQALAQQPPPRPCFAEHARASELDRHVPHCELG